MSSVVIPSDTGIHLHDDGKTQLEVTKKLYTSAKRLCKGRESQPVFIGDIDFSYVRPEYKTFAVGINKKLEDRIINGDFWKGTVEIECRRPIENVVVSKVVETTVTSDTVEKQSELVKDPCAEETNQTTEPVRITFKDSSATATSSTENVKNEDSNSSFFTRLLHSR